MSTTEGSTSIRVSRETKERIDAVRPYETVTYDEFIGEMADVYASVTGVDNN